MHYENGQVTKTKPIQLFNFFSASSATTTTAERLPSSSSYPITSLRSPSYREESKLKEKFRKLIKRGFLMPPPLLSRMLPARKKRVSMGMRH
jgi:hypothetical protein